MKKKFLALSIAAGLILSASTTTASAQVTLKDGSTTAGWGDTTVADLLPAGASIDGIDAYNLVLSFDAELTGEENFQIVMQNTVDWEWNSVFVGPSTEALNYLGNPYDLAYTKIDATTLSVTIPNEGVMKIMTINDKLAVGDWNGYVITEVKIALAATEAPAEEVTEPVEETPAEEVTEPAEEVTEPAEEVTEPAEEVTEPAEEVTEPAEEVTEPAEEVTEPAEEVTEPAEEVTEPAEEVTEPAEEVTEPAEETPSEDATHSTEEAPAETETGSETITVLPKTGLVSGAVFFVAGAAMMAGGALVAKKKED